jgi:hypothetical protein
VDPCVDLIQRVASVPLIFTQPRPPEGTTGVIHIVCQNPSRQTPASVFLFSLGGKKDGVGAFYLGKASGYDALAESFGGWGCQSMRRIALCKCSWHNGTMRSRT